MKSRFMKAMLRRYSATECTEGIVGIFGLTVMLSVLFLASGSAMRHEVIRRYTVTVSARLADRSSIHALAGRWTADVISSSARYGLQPVLVASVLNEENHGFVNRCAHRLSSAGAIGPMQLMPGTAWRVLGVNPWRPSDNIDGGARYLAMLLRHYHGRVRQALMAYNTGPTRIDAGHEPAASVRYADQVMRRAVMHGYLSPREAGAIMVSHGAVSVGLSSIASSR